MKRVVVAVVAFAASVSLAACGSSGTHTQSLSPSAPSSDPTSSSPSVSPSSSSVSSTAKPTTPAVPTPSVSAAAQPAVNAYVALYTLTGSLYADPAHANTADLSKYESAKLVSNDVATLKQLAAADLAYRGTLPGLRLKVVLTSPTTITLTNCGLLSKSDPYEQYNVKTGKTAASPTAAVPPPYLKVLTIQKSGDRWLLQSIATNTARTCTA